MRRLFFPPWMIWSLAQNEKRAAHFICRAARSSIKCQISNSLASSSNKASSKILWAQQRWGRCCWLLAASWSAQNLCSLHFAIGFEVCNFCHVAAFLAFTKKMCSNLWNRNAREYQLCWTMRKIAQHLFKTKTKLNNSWERLRKWKLIQTKLFVAIFFVS